MKWKGNLLVVFVISGAMLCGFGLPQNLQKKVFKEFEKLFDTSAIEMKSVPVSDAMNAELPLKITADNFFKLYKNKKQIGFAFIDQAPSKTAKFDYLVVFDSDLKVTHSKILIYREEYGGEIGSKRWLQQFLGKTLGDRVSLDSNIDGIAGATISVRSMTNSMDNILQTLTILKAKKVL